MTWGEFGEFMNLKRKFFGLENFDKLVKMNDFLMIWARFDELVIGGILSENIAQTPC